MIKIIHVLLNYNKFSQFRSETVLVHINIYPPLGSDAED